MGVSTASWSDCVTLPPLDASVAVARGFIRDLLIEHDRPSLVEDVRLVASELATNAIHHAKTQFTVVLEGLDDSVRLTVSDASTSRPNLHLTAPVAASGGRGLNIVRTHSRDWGVTRGTKGTKSVWASFTLTPAMDDESGTPGVGNKRAPALPGVAPAIPEQRRRHDHAWRRVSLPLEEPGLLEGRYRCGLCPAEWAL